MTMRKLIGTLTTPSKLKRNERDRKSTRLNSSHSQISYAVFCLKKKNKPLAGKIPSVKQIILMTDGAPAPADHGLGEMLDYNTLIAPQIDDYPFPKLSKTMHAAM